MTSLRGPTHQPLPSASLPTSPVEEDLAKASVWDDEDTSTLVAPQGKGKGKQRDDGNDDGDEDEDDDEGTVHGDAALEYPPIADDDLEARKVEQNLKRWETLEKQRRKRARESRTASSSSNKSTSPVSSLSDVGRRASQLWRVRPKTRTDRAHPHQVLEDVDEALPMDDTGPPSAASPTPDADADAYIPPPNPFLNPQYGDGGLMTASSPPADMPDRPALQVPDSSYGKHPPPQPLGLPAPASPPPPPGTQPQPPPPEEIMMEEGEGRGKRWWTEWLCGCREDGDNQAGRTNPME